jgi:hypothetical protein
MINRHAQSPMVIIPKRHETKGLQNTLRGLARGRQHFGHALHRAGFRLKCNFDEISVAQRMPQVQQATGNGYCVKFSSSAPAIF